MNTLAIRGILLKEDLKRKAANYFQKENGDSEFNDGGSSNWSRNMAIGFAIGGILLGLVKVFMPELVNAWKAKVMEWFN